MQIVWITEQGEELECTLPYPTAQKVIVEAAGCCPKCGAQEGKGQRALFCGNPEEHNWGYSGIAACAGCHTPLGGVIEVRLATLFGLEEDRRVLHGRCRVY